MRCVFEASSGVEAHMVLNLLQQKGIEGRVDGEYLQGGVGDLQAMNFVRVMVPEGDEGRAREIIAEWEAKQPTPETDKPVRKGSKGPIWFLLGIALGVAGTYWVYSTPVTKDGVDYNSDGQLDVKWYYKGSRQSRTELDRDRDGEPDIITEFTRRGLTYSERYDDNFNGVFEGIARYHYGNPIRLESDTNEDGHIDYKALYEDGVLRKAVITDGTADSPKKDPVLRDGEAGRGKGRLRRRR